MTLSPHLPRPSKSVGERTDSRREMYLAPTGHLVYFPHVRNSSSLLPDGTDSVYSPGPPFTRSMWEGGSMRFLTDIPVDGRPFHANERILDAQVQGPEGEEKILIKVEKLIFAGLYPGHLIPEPVRIVDERTLVFMRNKYLEGSHTASQHESLMTQPDTPEPDFSHTTVPTRELLFRFSALTFNAHAIHLDRQFCRQVEGFRNLVVHGPLTVVLMIEILQIHLQNLAEYEGSSLGRSREIIHGIEYRNLAPLYADEEMKICVKKRGHGSDRGKYAAWDVWIEGPYGGYAVKGLVRTVSCFTRPLDKIKIDAMPKKGVSGPEIAPQGERSGEGETPFEEHVASQDAVNTGHNIVTQESPLV